MMLWFLLSACVTPATAPDIYVARGAELTVDPDTLCDRLNCRFDEIDQILDVIPEVDGVAEVVQIDPTTFTVKGVTAGDTLLSISGLDKGTDLVERYMHAFVAPIHKFVIGPRCDTSNPSLDPWVFSTETHTRTHWSMYDVDMNELNGWPEFEAGTITLSELDPDSKWATFTMPDQPADIELRSALTSDLIAEFKVVSEADYTGFEAEFSSEEWVPVGLGKRIETAMLFDGRRACVDHVDRVLTTSTPEVCLLSGVWDRTEVEGSDLTLTVVGMSPGICQVTVEVPDYGWSEELTLTIVEE